MPKYSSAATFVQRSQENSAGRQEHLLKQCAKVDGLSSKTLIWLQWTFYQYWFLCWKQDNCLFQEEGKLFRRQWAFNCLLLNPYESIHQQLQQPAMVAITTILIVIAIVDCLFI